MQPDPAGCDASVLRQYEPIDRLDREQLEQLLRQTSVFGVDAGTRILERGSSDEWTFYLLSGSVTMLAADGAKQCIDEGTRDARRPIARLQPRQYDVVATEPSKLIRVATKMLLDNVPDAPVSGYGVNELSVEGDHRQAMLCLEILRDIEEDRLVLPSLPEQALRVRRMIQKDDTDARALARALAGDATMAAKLIRAANSALYAGAAPTGSCVQAIVRLGVKTTSQLVLAFALKELFNPSTSVLEERMVALWQHSTTIAGISFALGRMTPGFDLERAMLAGLLHDIGANCVLSYADRQPDLAEDGTGIDDTVEQLRGQLSGLILRTWNFPEEIVATGEHAHRWSREGGPRADYCDLVVTAHLLDILSTGDTLPVPDLGAVPAMGKLLGRDATPEGGLEYLERSQHYIAEIRELLQV